MYKTRKKLIFFSRHLKIGGMEKALVMLLNNLAENEMDITLVLEEKVGALLPELDCRVLVKEYKLSKHKNIIFRKFINLFHRIIWGIMHFHKYDFSCNYATYSVIGSRLAIMASENSALYVHSDYYNYFEGNVDSIKDFFFQQGIRQFKNVIFVAREAMQSIVQIYPEYANKFITLSNLIDKESVLALSNEKINFEKCNEKELVIFIGRLEEKSKRLSRLIKTFECVLQRSNHFQFLILGDGPDRDLCERLIQKYELQKDVIMLGEIKNPYPYIKIADCVILTSDFEGFPVVYNECLVLQTPMVTTIPVSDDFVDSRSFSVTVDKNPEGIAKELLNESYNNISFPTYDIEEINKQRIKDLMKIIFAERE